MAATNDDLLISISTDLTSVKRQLKQLGTDIGTATSGIQKQFDGMGKAIDASMTPVQKRINDMVGIANSGGKPFKEWKGALAEVGTGINTTTQGLKLSRAGMMEFQAAGVNAFQALASGMSVARVAQMEGAQVLGAVIQGTEGGIKGLGASVLGLATKFPIVTAAVVIAGAAFAAYELLGGESIRTLDEILKSHEANIKRLGDAYDQVVGKQQKYAQVSSGTVNLINDKDLADAKKKLQDAMGEIFSAATSGSAAGGYRSSVKTAFEPFKDAIKDLQNSAKDTSALRAFTDAVTAIGQANPNLKAPAQELITFSNSALDAASVVQTLSGVIPDAINTVDDFSRSLASIDSKPAQKELQDLFDKASAGTVSLDEIHAALAALEQANPDFSGIIASIGNIIIAARNASAAVNAIYSTGGGGSPNGRHESAQAVPDGTVVPTPTESPNKEDLGAAYDKAQKKASGGSKATKKTAADQFAGDIQSIKDRTAALKEEYDALGLSYEEQTKRQVSMQLEQTALKQVREEARKKGDADWQNAQLSPAQVKAIDDVSDAYARQADELKKAQEAQQLQRDVLKGVFDDLRSALDDGKLDWKDFANIAEGALNKIIDKIENDLINSIMDASNAGGSSGGILGSILSFFTGSSSSSSSGTGGLYADGGYTGPGGKNQPAGVVHKGEYVFDQAAVNRIGVNNLQRLQKGYADGGLVGGPSVPSIVSRSSSSATSITFAPTINMPNAQKGAGDEVTAALKAYQKDFTTNVVKAIREAKKLGMA